MEHHPHDASAGGTLLAAMSCPEQFRPVAELFQKLSDTTRLRIFWLLCHRESCGVGIAQTLGLSAQAVAHHLRILRHSGLVCCRREGKEVYYRACDCAQCGLLHQMMEQAMDITCPQPGEPGCASVPEQVHAYLLEHLDRHIPTAELARIFLLNPTTLKERFKEAYGESIAAHIRRHRMEKAASLLSQGHTVAQAAQAVGYESPSKFAAAFRERYGVNPREFSRDNRQKTEKCQGA